MKFKFSNGLRVYGPAGTKEILDNIINTPYTIPFAELPFKVNIYELSEGFHPNFSFTSFQKNFVYS